MSSAFHTVSYYIKVLCC